MCVCTYLFGQPCTLLEALHCFYDKRWARLSYYLSNPSHRAIVCSLNPEILWSLMDFFTKPGTKQSQLWRKAVEHCKKRNVSEEVFRKACRFCSYGLELISLGLNTSYCQTARFLWPFNTTSKRLVDKPNTRHNLGHQLVWNQRLVSYSLIPSLREQELSQKLSKTLRNTWWSPWPKMPPPCYTSSSPAFITP